MRSVYIMNGVFGPEPRSSGGNTSSNIQVRRLFIDLILMGWKGRASAMGVIKAPILRF